MAANIIDHGFSADKKEHEIYLRVIIKSGDILLRIRDNCKPFDPRAWIEIHNPDDPTSNIGIRMVTKLCRELNYRNFLGMNMLEITL